MSSPRPKETVELKDAFPSHWYSLCSEAYSPVTKQLRILLVEDHETVRQGLKLLIDREPDMAVADEASDGAQALALARQHLFDVAIMDLSLPEMSGLVATRKLKDLRPGLAIVSLTRHADKTFLEELLRAGASGYVLKQSPHDELLRAIRAVAGGAQYIDPALTHHLAAPFAAQARKKTPRGAAGPTERESDVLRRVAQGYSNKEIAGQLGLSVKTVEVHKANGMQKLSLRGRIELMRYAMHRGWLHED